jgi:phage shock protein PspC (stress-responsive transcriptional regulator)
METSDIPPRDSSRDDSGSGTGAGADDGSRTQGGSGSAGNRNGQRPPLRRSADGRIFAGVGAGVADYLGTDPTATRLGLAAVAVLGHVAIPAYAAAWALIPEEGKTRPRAAEFMDSVGDHVDSLITRVRHA